MGTSFQKINEKHNLVSPKTIDDCIEKAQHLAIMVTWLSPRGDYSYLVKPLKPLTGEDSSVENMTTSLYSLAHGADRKWKRGTCHGRLGRKYKREDLYRTALGSRVICDNKELLYDEAPEAYKKCETVISDIVDARLIEVVAKLRPVLTFKTDGDCSS